MYLVEYLGEEEATWKCCKTLKDSEAAAKAHVAWLRQMYPAAKYRIRLVGLMPVWESVPMPPPEVWETRYIVTSKGGLVLTVRDKQAAVDKALRYGGWASAIEIERNSGKVRIVS